MQVGQYVLLETILSNLEIQYLNTVAVFFVLFVCYFY